MEHLQLGGPSTFSANDHRGAPAWRCMRRMSQMSVPMP
jgi:hypothetical protein